jgi:hypothetical protein
MNLMEIIKHISSSPAFYIIAAAAFCLGWLIGVYTGIRDIPPDDN